MTEFILSNSDFCPHCCSYGTCDCSPLEVKLRELLPDDLYDSKDWRHASSTDRIKLLMVFLEEKTTELNRVETALIAAYEEIDYHTSQGGHI
jgi:hypothetical protein